MQSCTCIKLKTVDQRLTVVQQPILASGDVGTVRVEYALDGHWAGYTPSATFYTGAEPEDIYEQLLEDGACIIPWEVLQADGVLYIGLRGVDGTGRVKTAAPVRYRIEKGSPRGSIPALEPSPDVYQQILTLLIGDGINILDEFDTVEEFNSAQLTGTKGDAYMVAGDLYVWSVRSSKWVNVGRFKGDQGDPGDPGKNGVSCTHSWNGTILTVTSASGKSSADLKGEKGDVGDDAEVTTENIKAALGYTPANESRVLGSISRNDKRITNLERGLPDESFVIDNTVEYAKEVPSNALPYAEIAEIGGMTRKCTNLLNISAYCKNAGELNSDGSVTVVASGAFNCDVNYTGKLPSGTYTVSNLLGKKIYIQFSSGDYSNSVEVGGTKTFTYDGVSYVRFIGNDQSASESVTYKVMLNEGSTALPYEPYFEGLRSAPVTEVESVGVNKFDINNRQLGTIDSNGDLKCEEQTRTFYRYPFKENTRYTLSGYVKNHNRTGNVRFCVVYTDGTREDTVLLNSSTEWVYRTYTTEAEKTVDRITLMHSDVGYLYIKGGELMINEGTTALPYAPYVKHTLPIPEAVRNLDGYGWGVSADCYNYIDFEKGQFVKRIKKRGFDGTEEWDWSYYPTVILNLSSVDKSVAGGARISSHGLSVGITNANGTAIGFSKLNVALPQITTVEEWKSYLAEQYANGTPVTVFYELATPVITDISDLLPADNLIGVEGGGTVTMVNEYGYDVPSEVVYQVESEVISE